MVAAYRGNALRGPIEQGISMGLTHHLTGDPDCATMFRDVLFYYESLVREGHGGEWCFEHMLFIYAWTWRLFHVWDLIEESPAFSDDDRLRMTNLLLGLTHYVAGLSYFRGLEPGKEVAGSAVLRWQPEIRQNHATFAALSMSSSAGYFQTYYGIDGFQDQLDVCDAIFDGQAECYKPNDDGGGGGYCWLVPNHLMTYDFRNGSDRFLSGGHLRLLADYAVLITDNLGSLVGFGDVGSYGARRTSSPGVAAVLCKTAWFYNEGGYLWALRWMGGKPGQECYYRSVQERVPDWLTGITIAPFNSPLYEWVERHGPGGANIPVEEAFDKLTIRSGFEEGDFYLLLDGTSTFAHGHDDGNSIERLTWKGRMWLAETDYIWRRPRHHCSVVSICDGESGDMPSLAGLKFAETLGGVSATRSVMSDYNGVDWTRDLVWIDDTFLFVVDSVDILRDAEYDLRCLWRTLGDTQLEGTGLSVGQQGVQFRIVSADSSEKSLEVEHPRVTGQDPYAAYDFADGPVHILRERVQMHGRPGDRVRYGNLMVAGDREAVDSAEARRVGEGTFVLRSGARRCVVDCSGSRRDLGALSIRAGLFVVEGSRVTLLQASRFLLEGAGFTADRAVHAFVDVAAGRATLRVLVETTVVFTGVPGLSVDGASGDPSGGRLEVRLEPGEHNVLFDSEHLSVEGFAGVTEQAYEAESEPKQNRPIASAGSSTLQTLWQVDAGGAVTALVAAGNQVAAGSATGRVTMMDLTGEAGWEAETGGEVRALHAADFGSGCLLAGGRDCALSLFDAGGGLVWRRPFEPSHGRDQIVNAVTVSDLEGDGERAVVATDGWLVWALRSDGEVVWHRQVEHHAARSLAVGDVDGDGRKEVLVGTEYYNSNLLEADGRIRWTIRGGPGFEALALTDLNGDGCLEAVYGSMDGCVYAFEAISGRKLWTSNLGDNVVHGFPVEVEDTAGFVAGSESGVVALLGPDGARKWWADLGLSITGLCRYPHAGGDRFVAATGEGKLALMNLHGKVLGAETLSAPALSLTVAGSVAEPLLLVGTVDGSVLAMDMV